MFIITIVFYLEMQVAWRTGSLQHQECWELPWKLQVSLVLCWRSDYDGETVTLDIKYLGHVVPRNFWQISAALVWLTSVSAFVSAWLLIKHL